MRLPGRTGVALKFADELGDESATRNATPLCCGEDPRGDSPTHREKRGFRDPEWEQVWSTSAKFMTRASSLPTIAAGGFRTRPENSRRVLFSKYNFLATCLSRRKYGTEKFLQGRRFVYVLNMLVSRN